MLFDANTSAGDSDLSPLPHEDGKSAVDHLHRMLSDINSAIEFLDDDVQNQPRLYRGRLVLRMARANRDEILSTIAARARRCAIMA